MDEQIKWTPVALGHRPLDGSDPDPKLFEAYFFADDEGVVADELAEWWLILRPLAAGGHPGAFASLGRPQEPPSTELVDRTLAAHGYRPYFGGWRHTAGTRSWTTRVATEEEITIMEQRDASRAAEQAHDSARQLYGFLIFLSLVTAAMAIGALFPLATSYYSGMRWIVALSSVVSTVLLVGKGRPSWGFGLVPIALVWNPLVPLYITRVSWAPLDLGAAAFSAVVIYFLGKAYSNEARLSEEVRQLRF